MISTYLTILVLFPKEFIDNVVMPQVNSGKDILIVGHGAMNCSIIAKFRGTPLDKFWDGMTDNCQVVRLI